MYRTDWRKKSKVYTPVTPLSTTVPFKIEQLERKNTNRTTALTRFRVAVVSDISSTFVDGIESRVVPDVENMGGMIPRKD